MADNKRASRMAAVRRLQDRSAFTLITANGPGNVHSQAPWINSVGLAEFVVSMHSYAPDYTTIVFKVPDTLIDAVHEILNWDYLRAKI